MDYSSKTEVEVEQLDIYAWRHLIRGTLPVRLHYWLSSGIHHLPPFVYRRVLHSRRWRFRLLANPSTAGYLEDLTMKLT